MTKEEFIKKWNVGYENHEQMHEFAYEMGMDLEALSEWRGIDEQTPHDGDYLCLVKQKQECDAVWIRQRVVQNLFNNWAVNHNEEVTHWMPLPNNPNI